ncbi:MAG: hypothetical protein ACI4HI_18535 [Lachnospiraceae bacterium]
MKHVREEQQKKCLFCTKEEFKNIVEAATDGLETVDFDFIFEDISITETKLAEQTDTYWNKDIMETLSDYFGVKVESFHFDKSDPGCVWVCYTDNTPNEGKEIAKTNGGLVGYQFADGVHWHWKGREIAVIDEETSEIEWCVRKYTLPKEIIQAVYDRKNRPSGQWLITAKRVPVSATQGYIAIFVNEDKIEAFNDDKILVDGKWVSKIPDEKLWDLAYTALCNMK